MAPLAGAPQMIRLAAPGAPAGLAVQQVQQPQVLRTSPRPVVATMMPTMQPQQMTMVTHQMVGASHQFAPAMPMMRPMRSSTFASFRTSGI